MSVPIGFIRPDAQIGMDKKRNMLKIESLSVNYGLHPVLHDVSLNVHSGEVVALIGPNGAGKTTLIRAVSGVIPAQSGHIRTNGDDFH